MRPVNLLPPRYRRARATGERPGVGYAALGVLAVLFLMVLGYALTNHQITDAKNKTAKANTEAAAAQAKVGQLQAFGNFASLKASRESAVESIAAVRFDYERLMREMALVLPHDTYLTSFTAATNGAGAAAASTASAGPATATGPSVTIAGCAPSHPAVATAVVRLRQLHNVTDVSLTNSSKAGAAGTSGTTAGCKVSWGATLTFQPESPSTDQAPVPARLGGGQ